MEKYYYDISDLMRHNARISLSMGVRRAGKTRSSKKRAIKNALKGKQFLWLRHLEKEIDLCSSNEFLTDVAIEFPNVEFTFKIVNKIRCLCANDKILGYFLALKDYEKIKGVSFPDVTDIYLDECFKITSRRERGYNWVEALLSILDTVDNRRDVVKLIMLSNTISFTNEFFSQLDIKFPINPPKVWKHKEISLVIETVYSSKMVEERENSVIGKILLKTHYGQHSINNERLYGSDGFIINEKPPGLKLLFSLRYYETYINIFSFKEGIICDGDTKPLSKRLMAINSDLADRYVMKNFKTYQSSSFYKYLCTCVDESKIYYTSPDVKEIILTNL